MDRIMRMAQLVMALALVASLLQGTAAEDYIVGNATGWVSTQSAAFYTTWASRITFEVGDELVFTFATGAHDVAIVSKADFDSCNTANPISNITNGPATVRLNTTGLHYFICTFPGHCSRQKLSITVAADDDTPPPPPTTTTGTTPPPPPPPPSSASPPGVAFAFVFLSLAIAFFCC
ncbi:hypothetical protein Ddye_021098 [Dipteronia dyeriana]|uniref:Phytocyanin domain-containing protein n=1 Tax=Dipteronia dyeriana TaxID=168575 RepID=A0AAD9WX73_9ROSI|nr:hypothetical protein Ddye_021098 [Dipteronia dyeriana]